MKTPDYPFNIPGQVFIRIDDKKRSDTPVQFDHYDPVEFQRWNEYGWGIYGTPNTFRHAAPEEHAANKTTMDRNDRYLETIGYAFADLDIAKQKENLPLDEREYRKAMLYESLESHCRPSVTISTANGLQPLWQIEKVGKDDVKRITLWKQVMNGIIVWSREHGAKGDAVKDTARVLRVPCYYHQKGEPYLCALIEGRKDHNYTLEELLERFPFDPEPEAVLRISPDVYGSDLFAHIDIRDIVIRAYHAIGRAASFDGQGRVVLDGRQTGNFQGRLDDHQYIATSSGTEPVKGNKVTVAADILGCNNTEAVAWIRKEFAMPPPAKAVHFDPSNLPFRTMKGVLEQSSTYLDALEAKDIFSWKYPAFDEHLGGIYRGELILIGGESGTGKTTFVMSVLKHNAERHRVCFFTLEDALLDHGLKELYFEIGKVRKERGAKNYPWQAFRNNALTNREEYLADREEALKRMVEDSLLFYDRQHPAAPPKLDIETLEALVQAAVASGVGLIGIDHLHYFDTASVAGAERESKADRIEQVMQRIKALTEKHNIAILLLAHYRKLWGEKPTLDSFKDSISIAQTANVVINMWRDRGEAKEFAKARKKLDKANAKVAVLEEEMADREASGKGSTEKQQHALTEAKTKVIQAQTELTRADSGDEGKRFDAQFLMPKVRSPAGEKTIIMRFSPLTFEYEYVDSYKGTKQELSAEEKASLYQPQKRSLF